MLKEMLIFSFEKKHLSRLNMGCAILYLILTVIALLLIISAHVVNVIYRKHKSIKASMQSQVNPCHIHRMLFSAYLYIFIIYMSETFILGFNAHSILCNLSFITLIVRMLE